MKKLIAFLLVTCITLTLCACGDYDSYNPSTADEATNDSVSGNPFYENSSTRKDSNTYKNVAPSSDACETFIGYIDSIKTEYSYESYYKIEEALEKYNNLNSLKEVKHTNILKKITSDSIFNRVKYNNEKYFSSMSSTSVTLYSEFKDKDLKKYCSIVADAANYYISSGKIEDKEKVLCVLGNLKILEDSTTMNNAYVSDENCLLISPGMIETLEIRNTKNEVDLYVSTITHETMHLLQKGCEHTNKIVYHIGNNFKFDDMDIHPLFNNWFYEGSAEKLNTNFTGYKHIVYKFYIYYIKSLTLSSILNDKNDIYDLEESTLSYSLEPLFDYFSCKTEEDKIEVLNMIFSLEFIETDDEEFKNAVNPDMTEDELVTIKRDMKNSIFETLAKYFYKNLAYKLSKSSMPLNDIFYYITVFEHDVNSHINFADKDKKAQAKPFVENYTEIQDKFFELLSSNGEYTVEEITDMFNSYGLTTTNDKNNYTLNGLEKEKKEYIAEILERTVSRDIENLRNCI